MAGTGTGTPLNFHCAVARRTQRWDPELGRRSYRAGLVYQSGHAVRRTGRTKPRRHNGKMLGSRTLDTSHEYVCACGHVGWTTHKDILRAPLVEGVVE